MKTLLPVNQKTLLRDWRVLCEDIGERRAGSSAERRAAEFVARRWAEMGLTSVAIEEFPCRSLVSARSRVQAWSGGRWRAVEAQTLVGAPGTPDGRTVEGEIVWLEMPENRAVLKRGALRGKIAVLFGPLPTRVEHHRQLVAAQPSAVIHVDERLPFPWAKSDGVYPAWVKRHGMPPTVTVPYTEAWQWRQAGVRQLRVGVSLVQRTALSQNVIAELPGTSPQLPALVLSAHHDTQCDNPGADDNASGVVGLLALARSLAAVPRRRTIRFISFGCEEQLSVGSAAYVAAHRTAMRGVGLVVNFDSVASPLGHLELWRVGPAALGTMAERWLARSGVGVRASAEVSPFFDTFPFNRAGVPSLCFYRPNFSGGRWQHHSRHDTLANVSVAELARLVTAVAPLVRDLANRTVWPFARAFPADQRRVVRRLGAELFES
jgi:hypothetical protein